MASRSDLGTQPAHGRGTQERGSLRHPAKKDSKRDGQEEAIWHAPHYIVAWDDQRAKESRELLFVWGIAINDADNRVFLRQLANDNIRGLNRMPPHAPMHSGADHTAVFIGLFDATNGEPAQARTAMAGRTALKSIEAKIQSNEFVRA